MTKDEIEKFLEGKIVEDGYLMGQVSTNMVGSKVTFPILLISELSEMDESDIDDELRSACFDSCVFEWGYDCSE